jgi:putative protein-disulfide isomerase
MERPVINYIFDALCGWCYGFSPVITQFYENHQEHIDFRVISGGMILGEREGPIGEVAGYIKEAYQQVEETTGVKFGQGFLKNVLEPGTTHFTSLPAALAMATFRMYQPDNTVAFAARMQKAIYDEGLPPAKAQTFGHCAEDFGMNSKDFMKLMIDKDKLGLVTKEFEVVKQWGVKGFPTVVYQKKDKGHVLARGYMPLDKLEENLKIVKDLY